jgi:hypothetical protein
MKTVLSIPLIILLTFSGISVKFAAHYCGGTVAATKISLTGEPATCGMEKPFVSHSILSIYTNKCCEDVVSAYSLCNNYIASSSLICDSGQNIISIMFSSFPDQVSQQISHNSSDTNVRPPGAYFPNQVSRSVLCVFII